MMTDKIAEFLAAMLTDVEGVPFTPEDCQDCSPWLRQRRREMVKLLYPDTNELLRDLGGDCRDANTSSVAKGTAQNIPIIVDMEPGESVWVFGEEPS